LVSGVPLLRVNGDVDHSKAPSFEAAVQEALAGSDCRLLLDLSGCRYIDSGGINVMIQRPRARAERKDCSDP